jgi:periplasmic protein CpxP/Spy
MNLKHRRTWPRMLIASFLAASPLVGFAAPHAGPGGGGHGPPGAMGCDALREPMASPGFGPFPGGERAWEVPPPFLGGLTLTEEQQDKVFAILHAAAPAIREQAKALRKAREALEDLTATVQYGETRAKALAEASAKADSALALLRARTERDIYLLLTPEQRMQILDRRRENPTHGPGGPPVP